MAPKIGQAINVLQEYFQDDWVWDQSSKPPEVQLSSNLKEAYFYTDPILGSTGTAAVRGTKGFSNGEHYWEIIFLEPPVGSSVMVGVGTAQALLQAEIYNYVNLIGVNQESWGLSYKGTIWHDGVYKKYCDPFFASSTKIGVLLNMYEGTLTFYKNGECLGQAFSGLTDTKEPLYPIISSTASETELGVGMRVCRYLSLQEKCFSKIRMSLNNINSVNYLPIPNIMKEHIRSL